VRSCFDIRFPSYSIWRLIVFKGNYSESHGTRSNHFRDVDGSLKAAPIFYIKVCASIFRHSGVGSNYFSDLNGPLKGPPEIYMDV